MWFCVDVVRRRFSLSEMIQNEINKSKRAGCGSMKSCGFNVFKCIVNIYNEDFGVFGPPKAKKGVGSKAEQHGSVVGPVVKPKDDVMESQSGVGGDGGWFWALVIFLDAGGWMVELWSLLGRLWWQWILRWAEI